jgi:hypothetical protein
MRQITTFLALLACSPLMMLGMSAARCNTRQKRTAADVLPSEAYHVVSLGGRYNRSERGGLRYLVGCTLSIRETLCLVANPIMGHFLCDYSTAVSPQIFAATRYDLNVHSFDSDISLGIEYSAPNNSGQVLKAFLSLQNGLGLRLDGLWNGVICSIGLGTSFLGQGQTFGVHFEF